MIWMKLECDECGSQRIRFSLSEPKIDSFAYSHMGSGTTICVLTLDCGFEIIGSSCVDKSKFDKVAGMALAEESAMRQYEYLKGFFRSRARFEEEV